MIKKKIYFFATELINKMTWKSSIVFSWQNGMRGHWAWWWLNQINFVLEKLIEKNGIKQWSEIYQKFNEALLDIAKDEPNKWWDFPKSALVFMQKIDDNKIPDDASINTRTKKNVHSWKQGLGKTPESKEETAPTDEMDKAI